MKQKQKPQKTTGYRAKMQKKEENLKLEDFRF